MAEVHISGGEERFVQIIQQNWYMQVGNYTCTCTLCTKLVNNEEEKNNRQYNRPFAPSRYFSRLK